MMSRILHSSYVIDFLDADFDSNEISNTLKFETDQILKHIKNEELKDWEIQFRAIYGHGSVIRIYRRMPSSSKEKDKQITIHVPIPPKNEVSWGAFPNQFIEPGGNPKQGKNFEILSVNFPIFSTRTDYILNCLRRAIHFCFEDGFTINKIHVKIGHL
jgi:hypothetical protein